MATTAETFGGRDAPHGFQHEQPHAENYEEPHAEKRQEERRFPDDYQALLDKWDLAAYFYQLLAYALSFIGIICGIGVTYFVGGGRNAQYATAFATALGFSGAVCAAVSGVLRPMQIGNRYRNAWRMLYVGRLRFLADPSILPIQLCETVARCELIIGDFELNGAEGRTTPEDRPRNRKTKNALKLFESFLEWHRDTPRETLLELLSGQPDFGPMKELTQSALPILFAQRSAAAASDAHR